MKKLRNLAVLLALLPVLMMTSCKKDAPEVINGYAVLKTYMVTNNLDLPKLLENWVIDPKTTANGGTIDGATSTFPNHHVFDIRSAADFAKSHIKNAINVPLKDVVKVAADYKTKPIVVVCYTGQTSGQAVMALRLSGFPDAVVLKWGMAGWNAEFKSAWVANSGVEVPANGNLGVGHANWVTTAAPATPSFPEPVWSSSSTDGATILKERVQAVLDAGFSGAAAADVLANPSSYTIHNYWPAADYTTFGHYAGSFNTPTIALAGDLIKAFDPTKETLVYCYTGQTSSYATFWLNVLGYKTKGILFGANRMVYDQLKASSKAVYKGPQAFTTVAQ